MGKHDWMMDVCQDLAAYAAKNGLKDIRALIERAHHDLEQCLAREAAAALPHRSATKREDVSHAV